MATRFIFTPYAAEFPSTNFGRLQLVNRRPILAFDPSTSQACYWTAIAPQGLTGTLTAFVKAIMASATTGSIVARGYVEAIADAAGTPNLASAASFDAANSSGAVAVPATAGLIMAFSITLTNADAIAAGNYFRLQIDRDAANASDTAAGDMQILSVEFRDGA